MKVFQFPDAFAPLFNDKNYFIISGGRAGAKSYSVAAYFLLKLFQPEYFRGVICRYTATSVKKTILQDFLDIMNDFGLSQYATVIGSDTIQCNFNGNKIISHSMKLTDNSQQAKGKGLSGITHLLIDEATEISTEREYIKLIDSIRATKGERKIFVMFNPEAKSHWIHQRWFINGRPNPKWNEDHEFVHVIYKDNPFLDKRKVREYDQIKEREPERYSRDMLGEWQDFVEGKVYDNVSYVYEPDPESTVIYGLDFGFSNDPAALVKINIKGNRAWMKELLYQTGYTNDDIVDVLNELGVTRSDLIVADSAEPKSIEEIKRKGFNVKGAIKGPDSIRSGIQRMRDMELFVDPTSKNLIHEIENYAWKLGTNKPIDAFNHLLDSARYAITSDKHKVEQFRLSGIRRRA